MADSRLYVHVLLDRSGSMEDCRDKTIDAFNEYVGSLRAQSRAGTRLSLMTFDSESVDIVFDALRINDIAKLTRETFVPRGLTPLFDAVGKAVAHADKVTLLPDERVALAILTDGLENASQEMTASGVHKLLTDRQERCNWLVQYLGANQDAWAVGEQIGVGRALAMNYSMARVAPAMQSMARSAARYRRAAPADAQSAAAFTEEERASATDKTGKGSK
jgi:hypothetical protein